MSENFWHNVAKFDEILKKFNKIHSLTNYKDIKPVALDSIAPVEFLGFEPRVCVDVGSGAGFPAIFLAMIWQECEFHLYEPIAKKSSFLTYATLNLALKNVSIHSGKIEDCQKIKADLITSRAVMKAVDLIKICQGFYDESSTFLLYKGSNAKFEIDELKCDKNIYQKDDRNYVVLKGLNAI
ncbi:MULTISPECIES: 16S rRNA (guanine(527)-N(7))-methyltransferase RsmG [Campylobacter]|uniref:Ribosomal RNA small subunit methyltransferase G n=1 Tax=Campylobacter porcelli TaxID=1660073 RepID=A0ABU7M3P0_9BACT|nr:MULTISPECIES: 16S rRNA (guanine(527)-N(7))-methyltransferase RsmG [unclassified Campylobacter]MCR8678655.1 16S rRNA (guanine(527)-N(7))-methyltransferase RsmG [Campylobacter sp. RM19072]MCR8696596.1 16S rRNA (guanine(527)-N(7))-methyltransferase RsmG [Campylobacter sp. RM19073]MEE3704451.1 16S rRNA (guanine(527)-N(7))-methyltransferase RsmG [Campylobacter sp. CX2-8023-23]MEE3744321.1 16S rRNA (guanine(527)-N(7))-methyltransferase RsmG [Campylobacter sp. CX2-4855-23]